MLPNERACKWLLAHEFTKARPFLLLVEGEDEWHLLIRLLEPVMGITTIDVRAYDGVGKLGATLKSLHEVASGFHHIRTLAIWRDAETDAKTATACVQGALRDAGFAVPDNPGEFVQGSPQVGFFILPGDDQPGSLEDICLQAVAEDPTMPCVETFLECVKVKAGESEQVCLHPNDGKTRLHAYLASRREPGLKVGEAAKAQYLNLDHPAWERIKGFLRELTQA